MTHTPGPWEVKYSKQGYAYAINAPKDAGIPGAVGCVVRWGGIGSPAGKGKDNARLIAAAPALLTELKQARLYVKVIYDRTPTPDKKIHFDLTQIDAAIAKAEGRT